MVRILLVAAFLCLIAVRVRAQGSTASKQVSTFTIDAPQLGGPRKIWVYLPKSYAEGKKRYPVIYMHDAQNLFDAKTSFAGEWEVDETLDKLNADVIVIGIENGGEKRLDEMTPFPNEKYGGGKADSYVDFIVKTLKPHVDRVYRTKPKKKQTAIWGSSLGGLTSFYAALKYPDVFGKVGAFSPSFWYSSAIFDYAEKKDKIKARIVFLCGDAESEDMVPDMKKMSKLLDTKRCYCENLTKEIVVKDGKHNEKLWREGFEEAFLWLF